MLCFLLLSTTAPHKTGVSDKNNRLTPGPDSKYNCQIFPTPRSGFVLRGSPSCQLQHLRPLGYQDYYAFGYRCIFRKIWEREILIRTIDVTFCLNPSSHNIPSNTFSNLCNIFHAGFFKSFKRSQTTSSN